MDNRTNTIAMMTLGAMIVALGGTIASGKYFDSHRPDKMGYVVEGVEAEAGSAAAVQVDIATLLPTADPAKGAEVFKKCASCHTLEQGGANGIGPNLWATLGAKHGHTPGFAYSAALTGIQGPWTWEAMDKFLANPRAYAPGTKMTFAGLSKPEDRAAVMVYLNTYGSNLPLPTPAAAPAAADAPAAAAVDGNATAPASADNASGTVTATPAPNQPATNAGIATQR